MLFFWLHIAARKDAAYDAPFARNDATYDTPFHLRIQARIAAAVVKCGARLRALKLDQSSHDDKGSNHKSHIG